MIRVVFAMFALDASRVALMVNYVAVVSSAFTILFMFLDHHQSLPKKFIWHKTRLMTHSKAIAFWQRPYRFISVYFP